MSFAARIDIDFIDPYRPAAAETLEKIVRAIEQIHPVRAVTLGTVRPGKMTMSRQGIEVDYRDVG